MSTNMTVRNNASARTAKRFVNKNSKNIQSTLEKIATGYQINSAADDSCGLAMSERMRALITGLSQASENSQEGASLIQVGEGATQELHKMLNRAAELAATSANGILDDPVDRRALQEELDHLCLEIDRISKSTSFNGVHLFQDKGYAYETSKGIAPLASTQTDSLQYVLENTKSGEYNIIYAEETYDFNTTQTPTGSSSVGGAHDLIIDTASGTRLSQALQEQIIPNTVKNILANYSAFSYLTGSSIGIGLELYSDPVSSTLASVTCGVSSAGYQTYKLSVNVNSLLDISTNPAKREELEATIAHEMIHAFMDEASTAGMFGSVTDASGNVSNTGDKFPMWFIEGMAQTASGPGNWLIGFAGLNINSSSSAADIISAIKNHPITTDTTATRYGTGYLACMYLGAAIDGNGTPSSSVTASGISNGLNKLMTAIIGGQSMDNAINTLTGGKFTSTADFQAKFSSDNTTQAEAASFIHNLLVATGSGRGGLVSGDLTATDLTANTTDTTVNLFKLDPSGDTVKNVYPSDHIIFTGGTTSTDGVAPSEITSATTSFGDFIITGDTSGVTYDDATKTLTITGGNDIEITIDTTKQPTGITNQKIVVDGTGMVTMKDVKSDELIIRGADAKIKYTGKNEQDIKMESGAGVTFDGDGQIKAGSFTSDSTNSVKFNNGAMIVGNGSGNITAGSIIIDGGSVAGTLSSGTGIKNSSGAELKQFNIDWSKMTKLKDIAVVQVGAKSNSMLLDKVTSDAGKLWLDPGAADPITGDYPAQKLTFTDSTGASQVFAAKFNPAIDEFELTSFYPNPFIVTGGVEGTDWEFDDATQSLKILSSTAMTISGSTGVDATGGIFYGRIEIADDIGNVDLTLSNTTCKVSSGNAFKTGKNNQVKLTIADNTENTLQSGNNCAGIALDTGTTLTIDGKDPASDSAAGKLTTQGGRYGAGIGCDKDALLGTSSIIINGGDITARGGNGAAGIGAAYYGAIGNMTINGGKVQAHSDGHGAGIGGGWGSATLNGDITITGGTVNASSTTHGTGIGAGCQGTSGKITISGGNVTALGGDSGAGIGASWIGECGDIEITGGSVHATGGDYGAGIGAGSVRSQAGNILISTDGTVTAIAGENGVGIGSGYDDSSSGNITIEKGTVIATGSTDATGIGAGRDSISGNISIGVAGSSDKVVVTATGGMTNNGGNILSYTDKDHTIAGTTTIAGDNTTVKAGSTGEGLYNTSGVVDENGNKIFAYPTNLFDDTLSLPSNENGGNNFPLLPAGATNITISAASASGKTKTWTQNLSHKPSDENYDFIWMTGEDQKLTISYTDPSTGGVATKQLDLKFYADSGTFRLSSQPKPPAAQIPDYTTNPSGDPTPPDQNTQRKNNSAGGIILQIGAQYGETMEIPRFYLSTEALNMKGINISTQENAWNSMGVIKKAINRVSNIRTTYGAMSNRLEYNIDNLSQMTEAVSLSNSRIRDADIASEMTKHSMSTVLEQASQAMLAQANQQLDQVLQLLN